LLIRAGMSPFAAKIVEILIEKLGVGEEFATHLIPLFERVATQEPSAEEWDLLLGCAAAAYRSCWEGELAKLDETHGLVRQFLSEVRKVDESLRVLDVYLERLRQHTKGIPPARVLH
jgi:hypothetical protein